MQTLHQIPVLFYAESTPNPASMKFVANRMLMDGGATAQYNSPSEAKSSPLAIMLFNFPFVKTIFISANFITITKTHVVEWEEITLQLREFLTDYISRGRPVVNELPKKEVHTDSTFTETTAVFTEHAVPQNEIEHRIIGVLEQYIRPAVEQDGGLIVFKSFRDGVVTLILKGACSGCPSSTLTLKAGIEGLLKKFVPEVTEVIEETI
jgi:Fe-S cluster biogenesis protein NfuA